MFIFNRLKKYILKKKHYKYIAPYITINTIQICITKGYNIVAQRYCACNQLIGFINEKPYYDDITITFEEENTIRIDNFKAIMYAKYINNKIKLLTLYEVKKI